LAAPAARSTTARPLVGTATAGMLLAAAVALAGCGDGGLAGGLRAAGVAGKPDEFMVLPTRPLEMPANLAALPPPTPGRPNRVDYQPIPEAIAGLSGRPGAAGNADGSALVAVAGPRDPSVRAELAAEDAEWRRTHRGRLLERLTARDREALVYRPMVLDAPLEFERMRASGVGVPAASPEALDE
jgi:hypothetical protein